MHKVDDLVFKALADGTRRTLLDRLHETPGQSLNTLCAGLAMSRQSVSKHLALLEDANLVASVKRGREKHFYLNPLPIRRIGERWIDKFSIERSAALLRLKEALESARGESP